MVDPGQVCSCQWQDSNVFELACTSNYAGKYITTNFPLINHCIAVLYTCQLLSYKGVAKGQPFPRGAGDGKCRLELMQLRLIHITIEFISVRRHIYVLTRFRFIIIILEAIKRQQKTHNILYQQTILENIRKNILRKIMPSCKLKI